MAKYRWNFTRKPFWVFTHILVLSIVVLFVILSLWQFKRLDERKAINSLIEDRAYGEGLSFVEALSKSDGFEYLRVEGQVEFVEDDVVRVVNRSQGGAAGEHVVALAEFESGQRILANRGFVPLGTESVSPPPSGTLKVEGWLRESVEQELFGVTDSLETNQAPRFDINAISARLEDSSNIAPVWLQLESFSGRDTSILPDPVPLPELSEGSHFSYAIQWLIFAFLTILFYGAILKKNASNEQV